MSLNTQPPIPSRGVSVLSYLSKLHTWLKGNRAIAGAGLRQTQTRSGIVFSTKESPFDLPFNFIAGSGLVGTVAQGFVRGIFEASEGELNVPSTTVALTNNATNYVALELDVSSSFSAGTQQIDFDPGTGDATLNVDGDTILNYTYAIGSASIDVATTEQTDTFPGAGSVTTNTLIYVPIAEVTTSGGVIQPGGIVQKLKSDFFAMITAYTWSDIGTE